jgi:hypothetical protein
MVSWGLFGCVLFKTKVFSGKVGKCVSMVYRYLSILAMNKPWASTIICMSKFMGKCYDKW